MNISLQALVRILRRHFPDEEVRISGSADDSLVWITMRRNNSTAAMCYDLDNQKAFNASPTFRNVIEEYCNVYID
jgi:hypothetical protein